MSAPRLLAITPGDHHRVDRTPWIRAMASAGLRALLIREPDLDRHAHDALVMNAWAALPLVVVHDRNPRSRDYASSLHLADGRDPAGHQASWSQSCHDAAGVERSLALGAAWVTLSPVWRPTSKPADQRPTLGEEGFLQIAKGRPVLALGGVTPERAGRLLAGGAAGVAVCGPLFDCSPTDAAARCRAYIDAIQRRVEPNHEPGFEPGG